MTEQAPSSPPVHLLQRLCTAAEMRAMDSHAINTVGLPGRVLMENAARAVADRVGALSPEAPSGPVVVCCGSGNNGGDGYAIARLLANRGAEVSVVALGTPPAGDAGENRTVWQQFGATLDFAQAPGEATALLARAGVIVDALFGTGLSRPVEGAAADLIAAINRAPHAVRIAVDVPSGLHADTGAVLGCAVRCAHTVTLQVGKAGLYQFPAAAYAGRVAVADISIPQRWAADAPPTFRTTPAYAGALCPARPRDGHKGTFGHLLLLCGSAGMGGAAALAGMGALRAGTGLVTAGVPGALRDAFLGAAPELMTLAAPEGPPEAFHPAQVGFFLAAARARTGAVLGCGLGRREATRDFAARLVADLDRPLLIDADGLNLLGEAQLTARRHPTVVTPHPGEFARLAGITTAELATHRLDWARRKAAQWGAVVILKGAATVIAAPDGTCFLNPTGDEGLATAGTGDVLSGLVGGLLAQGKASLDAAVLGVYLHGLARDLAAARLSSAAFTATDLVAGINGAWQALRGETPGGG